MLGGPQSGDANLHYGAGLENLPKRCLERPRPLGIGQPHMPPGERLVEAAVLFAPVRDHVELS
jgi:hypothetical protein